MSSKIVRTSNCTQTAVGHPQGLYSTVITAAILSFLNPQTVVCLSRQRHLL